MTRQEKAAAARRLIREEGLTQKEAAKRLGVARSTLNSWLVDPDGSRLRAREDSYRGTCVDCGGPTYGGDGPTNVPERCHKCHPAHAAKWTRESIVAAIQRFHQRYGRQPNATDFNPPLARSMGHHWRADRFHADGDYPGSSSVQYVFGTWNAAIEAAGLPPLGIGVYPRVGGRARGIHLSSERQAA